MIEASELGPPQDSVALAFQMRAIPKRALETKMRALTDIETAEFEMATDEALGRLDPETA
jgi:mRNA-degrading endonuclease toxin of MazEF toxin-antitoxin module